MAEEAFFNNFREKVRRAVKELAPRQPQGSWAVDLYLSKWNSYNGSSEPRGAVVACDGSIATSSFSGGLVTYTARAMAHIYTKEGHVKVEPDVDFRAGYGLRGGSLFLKALELRSLREAVEKARREHGTVFAVFDGSLYFTFVHYMPHLEATSWAFKECLKELSSLLDSSQDEGVSVVGVSKDSDVSYLRAKILQEALLKAYPALEDELAIRGRSIKRMAERLREKAKGLPEGHPLWGYLAELELEVSDEGLYGEIAQEPGFTTPLLLAPQTIFLSEEIEGGARDWWGSSFRRRLKSSGKLSFLAEGLDSLYEQPPVAIFYWKPRAGSGVYRVDVPSNVLGYRGRCADLAGDIFADEEGVRAAQGLVATLNWLSRGTDIVSPLTEVDAVVRLERGLYKQAYEPIIVEELRREGFRVGPRRRSIRDYVLRGY